MRRFETKPEIMGFVSCNNEWLFMIPIVNLHWDIFSSIWVWHKELDKSCNARNEIFCRPFSSAYPIPGVGLERFPAATGKYSEQVTGLTQRDSKPFTLMHHRLTCMSLHCERKDPERTRTERPRPNDCGCGHSANLHANYISHIRQFEIHL